MGWEPEFGRQRGLTRSVGDNANHSHYDRCQPLTDRKALAAQHSSKGEGLQNDQVTGGFLRDANATRRTFSCWTFSSIYKSILYVYVEVNVSVLVR